MIEELGSEWEERYSNFNNNSQTVMCKRCGSVVNFYNGKELHDSWHVSMTLAQLF